MIDSERFTQQCNEEIQHQRVEKLQSRSQAIDDQKRWDDLWENERQKKIEREEDEARNRKAFNYETKIALQNQMEATQDMRLNDAAEQERLRAAFVSVSAAFPPLFFLSPALSSSLLPPSLPANLVAHTTMIFYRPGKWRRMQLLPERNKQNWANKKEDTWYKKKKIERPTESSKIGSFYFIPSFVDFNAFFFLL